MTASFISELDSASVAKLILTELLLTDKHAPAGVLYANGVIVSTAAPYPVGGTLLTSLETKLASIDATAASILTAANAIKVATEILDNAIAGNEMQVDVVAPLPAGANLIGKVDHASTGIGDGRTVVTTAGTRVALAGSTVAKTVIITAETDNTGIVVVGAAATVVALLATRRGTPLNAGDTLSLPIDNLADIGLDSTVSTDGVTYSFTT